MCSVMSLARKNSTRNFRIVVMGATGVGKTSIISQFIHNKFPDRHRATVEELHRHVILIDTTEAEIDILDTSGTFEFPAMRKLAIATGNAFILVYSSDVENSFDMVKTFREEIVSEKKSGEYCIIVVKNKIDLTENKQLEMEGLYQRYEVSDDWNNAFICTSAKSAENVSTVFLTLQNQIRRKVKEDEKRIAYIRRTSAPALSLTAPTNPRSKSKSRNFSVN